MNPIRIGIVGLGGICRSKHVPLLQEIDGVELVAVANRTLESSREAADEFAIPDAHDSWEELVARDDLDAIVIGTWPYLHRPVSLAALQSGKHVFCQARIAMNADEAREMLDAAHQSGRVAAVCPVPIGLSVDRAIERLMREGYLGDLRLVRVQSLGDNFLDPDAPATWRKDHRLSGLNMLKFGMYVEVIHRWLPLTRKVSAMAQTFVPERKTPDGETLRIEIPDQFLVNTEQEGGVPVQYVFSSVAMHGGDGIEIYGTNGMLLYDVDGDVLYGAQADEELEPIDLRDEEVYDVDQWTVERDFIAAIREGRPFHPDFEDGWRYMQVVQAAYESSVAGCTIHIGS